MAYPTFKNKHLEEALIFPDHFGEGRKEYYGKIPNKSIILYQNEPFNYLKGKFEGEYKELKVGFSWLGRTYFTKDFCFSKMSGVGAPHATLMLEELIALGIKEFLNIGTSGGIESTGIFLCTRSIRDEGTSQHYLPYRKYAYPDKELTKRFEKHLKKRKMKFSKSTNWTIDAPFRETRTEIKYYKKQGVSTVEMEASALFTVAKVRKVKIAAAFTVSDTLGEEWRNIQEDKPNIVKENLISLVDAALDCFSN